EVGRGGMARVFLGRDLKHDRQVAVKILHPELASGIGQERFLREIQLAARLSHPHILPLYDSGEDDGHLYFVMPYVEGGSLRERMAREGRIPEEDTLEIARAVAGALDYAHRQGIVHRDIKPENIMIHDGVAMVTDFGIGKALSAVGGDTLTQQGALLGTPAYMSPEQIAGQVDVDGRSDLYSLGCVLYEMLTGDRVFTGPTVQAIIAKRLTEPSVSKSLKHEALPPAIEGVLAKVMSADPADRHATGSELAAALAFAVVTQPGLTASPSGQETTGGKSIAVLPFANMSADPENEYFSDGITEEIINALTQLDDLHVAARSSSFLFRDKGTDIAEVGARLKVATVLEGSVRKSGNRVRITAQLINVADGYHLWSERYDREMDDVFAIQDEIASTIADRLKVTLSGETDEPLVKPPTANLEAYQLYLKGRYLWNKRTQQGLEDAIDYFRRAIVRDGGYALAYAGLADVYLLMGSYRQLPGRDAHAKANEAADKALALDDTVAEAHASRAQVLREERDWRGAETEYRRAIELNPNYATAHQWYATLLAGFGRNEEAIREIRRAEELHPLSHAIGVTVATVLFLARDYDATIEQLEKTLALEPTFFSAHAWLGIVYAGKGMYDEAIRSVEQAVELSPKNLNVLQGAAYA
ncbi:MAG: protein kinase, partial [Gemmatimonadota bacterium]